MQAPSKGQPSTSPGVSRKEGKYKSVQLVNIKRVNHGVIHHRDMLTNVNKVVTLDVVPQGDVNEGSSCDSRGSRSSKRHEVQRDADSQHNTSPVESGKIAGMTVQTCGPDPSATESTFVDDLIAGKGNAAKTLFYRSITNC